MKKFRRAFVWLGWESNIRYPSVVKTTNFSFNEVKVEASNAVVVLETDDEEEGKEWLSAIFTGPEDAEDALAFAELKNEQEKYK